MLFRSAVSEEVEIALPDGWETSINEFKELLIDTPEGQTYRADEIVASWGNEPVLNWYDGSDHRIKLTWKTL